MCIYWTQTSLDRFHEGFFLLGFSFTATDDSQDGRGREGTIYSTLPLPSAHEHSDIYFATFHVRWLSHISNRTACIFRAATWLDLPPYRITIWLINDVMLFVYLLSWVKVFVTAIGNRWTQTRIDYHPRITSKPTNEVC